MRVYYDPDIDRVFVEGTSQTWAARSLVTLLLPNGLCIAAALTLTPILGPLLPSIVQRQDGTNFADQDIAKAYLDGEFARFDGDFDGQAIVAAASLPAGTPCRHRMLGTGQVVAARADSKALGFRVGGSSGGLHHWLSRDPEPRRDHPFGLDRLDRQHGLAERPALLPRRRWRIDHDPTPDGWPQP